MLNYIATENTAKLIQKICKNQNILILYEKQKITNLYNFLKETKVNFNLVKQFIIEIGCLEDSESEIIESICNFSKLHINTRIIILVQGIDNQSKLLTGLYDNGIYNIINEMDELEIERQLIKALSEEGIQKKEVKRFEKIEEIKNKKIPKVKQNKTVEIGKQNDRNIEQVAPNQSLMLEQPKGVYFFALILEAITRLIKLIGYIAIFILTSIGITILLNSELREVVFQIFGLK